MEVKIKDIAIEVAEIRGVIFKIEVNMKACWEEPDFNGHSGEFYGESFCVVSGARNIGKNQRSKNPQG